MINNTKMNKTREAKVKKQKETHSEIERKRRERMKRETEFLSNQLQEKTVRKDKLSIYKTGAEQLLKYTETLGKREFILNDNEYSAIVLNNFDGMAFHIQCSDGEILWCSENVKNILGIDEDNVIGTTLYSICEPSYESVKIIESNLMVDETEKIKLKNGELVSRNFIIGMVISNSSSRLHCSRGYDGKWYRFIELCGDIWIGSDDTCENCETNLVLKCLGRPLELASNQDSNVLGFTVKLHPESFQIIEIVGNTYSCLEMKTSDLIDHSILDYITDQDKNNFKKRLSECIYNETVAMVTRIKTPNLGIVPFSVTLNVISVNKRPFFIIGKFLNCNTECSNQDECRYIKKESCVSDKEMEENIAVNNVIFELNDCCETLSTSEKPATDDGSENTSLAADDYDELPSNESFKNLLGDCNELFQLESIRDLVSEDINDIKCDNDI